MLWAGEERLRGRTVEGGWQLSDLGTSAGSQQGGQYLVREKDKQPFKKITGASKNLIFPLYCSPPPPPPPPLASPPASPPLHPSGLRLSSTRQLKCYIYF